ncbi:MAG: hypothetical protein IJ449_08150 [Clostridia bacterium]|nr:hypothetical protein [Clostridia bacterium]
MNLWERLKKLRGFSVVLVMLAVGLLLLLFPGGRETSGTTEDNISIPENISDIPAYEAYLAHMIAQMTDALDGVSGSTVLVALDSLPSDTGTSSVFGSTAGSESTTVPRLRGIAVVCRGGGNPDIQLEIISLLCAVFDLPAARVYVGEASETET